MLSSLVLALTLFVNAPAKQVNACETYAPRLDGISVTVCAGSVVRACDASGNCTR